MIGAKHCSSLELNAIAVKVMALIQLSQKSIILTREALSSVVDLKIIDDVASLMDLDPADIAGRGKSGRLEYVVRYFNTLGRIVEMLNSVVRLNPAARTAANAAIASAQSQLEGLRLSLGAPTIGVIERGNRDVSTTEGKPSWLQRLVQKDPQSIDHAALLLRMIGVGQRICRIEREGASGPGPALGTGFLIGKDLVLTNWHVVEPVHKGHVPHTSVRCRFDFLRDSTGTIVANGQAVGLSTGFPWLLDSSSYAPGDDAPDGREANADELDYAMLKVDQPVGDQFAKIPGTDIERRRGWYDLDRLAGPAPVKGDELVVVGHAEGKPLTHAMGGVLNYAAQERRLRHDAFTLGGSSGSPVFNSEYQLIALHHAGDPDPGKKANFNQAIPIGLVAARSAAKRKA